MSWSLSGRLLKRVLITRLRYLGDVVMSTVVLTALRRGDPDLQLDYLCEAAYASVLSGDEDLKTVYALGSKRRGSDAAARQGVSSDADDLNSQQVLAPQGTFGLMGQLRQNDYDLAVDLFFNPRSAWLLRLAGIRQRIGGTRKSRRHLYTHSVISDDMAPQFAQLGGIVSGGLVEHLGRLAPLRHQETGLSFLDWVLQTYQPGELMPRLAHRTPTPSLVSNLQALSISAPDHCLVLAPGATWPTKEWPLALWQDLVRRLVGEQALPVVVISPPGGAERWAPLSQLIPQGRGGVLPPLPLEDVLSLVGQAAAMITVDGGVMHAAVAMGTPTVALFGPTDTDIWFPYTSQGPFRVVTSGVACQPCDLHTCADFVCMPGLDAQIVMNALAEVVDSDMAVRDDS